MSNNSTLELKDTREVRATSESAPVLHAADYQVGAVALNQISERTSSVDLPGLTITGLEQSNSAAVSDRSVATERATDRASHIGVERGNLLRAAQDHLTPEQLVAFSSDMNRLEQRLGDRPDEVAQTYKQVERLLQAGAGATLEQGARNTIALEVMHQAADPRSIQQALQSCPVASLESRIYTRHPASAAELVADVATGGAYHGQQIDRDSVSYYQYPGAQPGDDTVRSYASQVFQITAANVFQQLESGTSPTTRQYILTPPSPGSIRRELLVDRATNAVIADHPGITLNDREGLRRLNNAIVGVDEPAFVVTLAQNPTEQDFRASLQRLETQQNFPALLAIRADSALVNGTPGNVPYHLLALEQGSDSEHVFINNQVKGRAGDFETTVGNAFNAMRLNDDVVDNSAWRRAETNAFHSFITMAKEGQLNPEMLRNLQNTLYEFKPEHIRAIEATYEQQFDGDLPSLLSDVLKVSDEQMKLLGYEHNFFSGWTHVD
ncbi:hypothetical protein KF728_11070 [Candidatus Obscuribacterales bacterium]|nr:hypothetical protein [Candidatus Obscuribacterales bacterium]